MSGKLRRFLHLERPRGEREPGPRRPATGDRFAALEEAPPPAEGGTGAAAGRFGPERGPTLELAAREEGSRPFQRCMACGRDHGLHETACPCGARLDSPEQQAWNERLWEERRAEEARQSAEAEEARARAEREAEELARLRREMGIELARHVGQRERERLGMGPGGPALGVRLLALVPERWKVHALAAGGGVWLVLVGVGLARRSPGLVFLAIIAAMVLLLPPGRGRGRWGGWDGS